MPKPRLLEDSFEPGRLDARPRTPKKANRPSTIDRTPYRNRHNCKWSPSTESGHCPWPLERFELPALTPQKSTFRWYGSPQRQRATPRQSGKVKSRSSLQPFLTQAAVVFYGSPDRRRAVRSFPRRSKRAARPARHGLRFSGERFQRWFAGPGHHPVLSRRFPSHAAPGTATTFYYPYDRFPLASAQILERSCACRIPKPPCGALWSHRRVSDRSSQGLGWSGLRSPLGAISPWAWLSAQTWPPAPPAVS